MNMRVRKITVTSFLIFVCLLAPGTIIFPSGTVCANQEQDPIIITIIDAFYADLDNGGVENDIYVNFTLKLSLSDETGYVWVFFRLVLPSGTHYHYYTSFSVPYTISYVGMLYFYNYATEPGWYEIKSFGLLFQEGDVDLYSTSYIFDPPGGTGSDDPHEVELLLIEISPSDTS